MNLNYCLHATLLLYTNCFINLPKFQPNSGWNFGFQCMDIIFKMIILLDHKSDLGENINNSVVQSGDATSGSLVCNISSFHTKDFNELNFL